MSEVDITTLFNQAWVELRCPPVRLVVDGRKDRIISSSPLSVRNGTVYFKPDVVPRGCDPDKFLLWYFRHELAHVHYCPYDIKTAFSLERAALQVVNDWNMAYLATCIFSDLEVNLNFLPKRFREIPYLTKIVGNRKKLLPDRILFEVYMQIQETFKPKNKALAEAAREIIAISQINKSWHTKVQMIAIILNKFKMRNPRLFSDRKIERCIREHPILLREDFMPNSIKMFEETFGTISDNVEAKEFFKQWIAPRIPNEKREEIKNMLKKEFKTKRKGMEKDGKGWKEGGKESSKIIDKPTSGKPSQIQFGEEPHLPTSLSKPYGKINSGIVEEAFWKRYWYRARAENAIIQYLAESPHRRPVWSVIKYPDDWYIEDEIESLDIEMSLDEGPFIPEVTTQKWVEEPALHGQSVISGFVPSAITILDTSLSMSKVHDTAAISAFIVHLSALKSGGETATLNFSTKYVVANWDAPNELKELSLSMSFGEFTVFPAYEIINLAFANRGNCFIVIITDGGWQNIDEAAQFLEKITEQGHQIFMFLLPGGEYPDRIKYLTKNLDFKLYKVKDPEADLQNLVLAETMKTYKRFLD